MKMKRIILKDWEARAFYAGTLTQLRRPLDPQPHRGSELTRMQDGYRDGHIRAVFSWDDEPNAYGIKCPLGQPGHRLWVAETHRFDGLDQKIAVRDKRLDEISYRADMYLDRSCDDCAWRSPATMPRWASRSIIELTAVRVERVQDVTEEEASRFGCECMLNTDGTSGWHADHAPFGSDYSWLKAAKHRWIADRGQASWDRNDWVWVRDVRRVEK